jgi:aminoglycoside phosphotransferase (APT) family kinase protein
MKIDVLDFLNFDELNTASLEAIDATTWVKRQFVAWHLHPGIKSVKPYEGLDTMLLFSWVLTKFSKLDNQPFVLHYGDLRMPNIIIDQGNNMIA